MKNSVVSTTLQLNYILEQCSPEVVHRSSILGVRRVGPVYHRLSPSRSAG